MAVLEYVLLAGAVGGGWVVARAIRWWKARQLQEAYAAAAQDRTDRRAAASSLEAQAAQAAQQRLEEWRTLSPQDKLERIKQRFQETK